MRGPTVALCATALLLLFTPSTNAGTCRTGCNGVTPNLFKYAEGTTYKYDLEGSIDISLSSAEDKQTSSTIKGSVLLTQKANCVQDIKLVNFNVYGPDNKRYENIPNIDKAISINFHDGHVEDEICVEAGDTQNSINVKRAVASMFQAAMNHHHGHDESDVFGDCPTEMSSRNEGKFVVIHKNRNLNRCAHRENIKQDFMATSFNDNSEIHSSPLLAGNFDSTQKLENGILKNAVITEHYLYKPFSDGKNGAKATVTTKLTFKETTKEPVASKAAEPRSIHFENPHIETVKSNEANILNALKETKKSMDISVTETSAKTFARLIKILRVSKKDDILAVYRQIKAGTGSFKEDMAGARKVYFDALVRAGTGDAVEAMVALSGKELTPIEKKLVYLSLSFIRHATPGALKAVVQLLKEKDLPREAYLAIGTLAGHYCKEHACEALPELKDLTTAMAGKIKANPASHQEENVVIAIMKGLANMHHLSDSVVDTLITVASDKKAPNRLRVVALETFQADACKGKLRDAAMKILKDRQEDSEIRIKAYLVVAECPDNKIAHALQELLDTEPIYQVGGFIVSHLRNLRASANPDREHAKQYLSMVKTEKKFPIDPRKYSYNTELSYTVDSAGVGSSVEANVIYSQNSFLPRSTSLNLTAEFFGHTFNFLEVGTRQENLDKVLEHYFGPLGVLTSHTPEELVSEGRANVNKMVEHIKKRFEKTRGKRDVSKSDIEGFAKKVKAREHVLDKDLDLDLSVKILGSEMMFLSINEDIEKLTPNAIIDKFFDGLDKGIDQAKNFEYHMKNHLMFLDVEVSYPTSMGFPLKLAVEGSSANHFITHGSVDIRQMLKDPKNSHVKVSVIPSANIELTGSMMFDAHLIETGLKVTSTILTSTGADLEVKLLDNGKGVDVKLGLPVEKQKLFSYSHKIMFSTQELGKPEVDMKIKFKTKPKEMSICFDQLAPIIGLTFCGDVNIPSTIATNNVAFPLNGPVTLAFEIEREDVKDYHFKALLNDKKPTHKSLEISFETPGSQNKRDVKLTLEAMTEPNKMLKATFDSPLKTATAEAVITDNAKEKSAMARFQHDKTEYYGKIGVEVSGTPAKSIYKPIIEYSTPGDIVKSKGNRKPDYTVEGQVVVENGNKFTFDQVKLIAPNQPPIAINGFLAKEGEKMSADVKVTREQLNFGVKGSLETPPRRFKLHTEMDNNLDSNINFLVDYDLKYGEGSFEHDLKFVHGPDLKAKDHTLTLAQSCKHKRDNNDFSLDTKNKLTYGKVGLVAQVDINASKKHLGYDFELAYEKFKMDSELDAKINTKQTGDYDIKFELEAGTNKMEVKAKRDIAGDKSTIDNMVLFNGRKYQVEGTVMHHVKTNDLNIGTDLTIKIHGQPDPTKIVTKVIATDKEIDSSAKVVVGKGDKLVDMLVKGKSGPDPSGEMKVFVKTLIDASGSFTSTNGVGTGTMLIDLPKMSRKIKADTAITCKSPTHNAKLDVFFDHGKDNTKKMHIETNNQITKNSVESKNSIDFLGNKMEANVKGKMDGQMMDGKIDGDFDVLLPNGHYITGKMFRELHKSDKNLYNGNGHIALEHRPKKDGPGYKLDVKAQVKDTDANRKDFDLSYNVLARNYDGKDFQADIVLKHTHSGEQHNSVYKTKVHGSMVPQPMEVDVSGTYTHNVGNYKASAKYGPKLGLNLAGKYDVLGGPKPMTMDCDFELITPNDKFKDMKLHASGSFLVPQKDDGHFELSGQTSATLNNEKTVKLEANMKAHKSDGTTKITLTLPKEEPMSFEGYYNHVESSPGVMKCKCGFDVHYAKNKNVKVDMKMNRPNSDEMEMEFDVNTPADAAKHINLVLKGKRLEKGKHVTSEVILTADTKRYALTNDLVISEVAPSLDVTITYPDKKTSRIHAKFVKVTPKQFTGDVKLENLKDFSLDLNGEANLESVDDFHIKVNAHSDKLKLDHVTIEAENKPSKSGKVIEFSAKSKDKNILSGSTNYKAHEEGGKFIVEGSGTFKLQEETKNANFKFIRQTLQQDKEGEHGQEIVLNAGLGNRRVVGELKLTNKQFRILNTYCSEGEKDCAHVEVYSKASADDAAVFNHELMIHVDLRKLGLSHEFGLKAVTNRKNFILDHTVDVHFEKSANSKYQYSLYVHPKEAGIVFTMPKRVIALEGKVEGPAGKKFGPVKGEVAFYMNKVAEPGKKTLLSFTTDVEGNDKKGKSTFEVKFNNPNLNKELMVKYDSSYDLPGKKASFNVDIDVFGKKSHKISINGESIVTKLDNGYKIVGDMAVVSKGFDLNMKSHEFLSVQPTDFSYGYDFNYQLEKSKCNCKLLAKLNKENGEVLVRLMDKDLVHVESKMDLTKESQTVDSTITTYGMKPYVTHFQVKNFNTMVYSMAKKDNPSHKLQVSAGLILGQIADFRAEVIKGSAKNDLVHASIKLDDAHFMKPDFGINTDNIQKMVLDPARAEASKAGTELKKLVDDYQKHISMMGNEIAEAARRNAPNLKPMITYYQTELTKLKDELVSDKTIQDVAEFLKKIFGAAAHTISDVFTRFSEVMEKVAQVVQEYSSKFAEFVSKEILPAAKEIGGKVLDLYVAVMKNVYDMVMIYVVKLSEILKEHQGELKQVATVVSEAFQDIGQIVFKALKNVRDEMQHLLQELYEQVKALPIFEELKARYDEMLKGMPVPDHVISIMKEVFTTVKDVLPTPEMKEFVTTLQTYLEKKMKQEKVDDAEYLGKLYTSLMKAINSMAGFMRTHATAPDDVKGMVENLLPLPIETLVRLPQLAAVKLSPLNLLTDSDFPTPKQILHGISFNPKHLIPPFEHHAIVIQGQHIFTFDQRHLTFPGTCSYVFARDFVNGNFTIVGSFKAGILDSLTFSDKKDVVTVKKAHEVTLNGAATEMPIRRKDLEVFRLYETVNIVSKSGVRIVCEPHLLGCGIYVSGFYHGQMRGLLGNGNHEPYDDFALPNGKISTKEDEFGNAYSVGGGCTPVKTVDHHHHEANPACDALFGMESSMKLCYAFVSRYTFKQACEHGMAAKIADTEKAIAMAYVAACRHRGIPINTPSKFVQCKNNANPIDMGSFFSVKLPGKAADVVIAIEQNKNNEPIFKELIQPLVTSLTTELTAKGVTDIEFSLIGYGGEYQKWPSHYTTGGKIKFHGKAANLKFVDPPAHTPLQTGCSKMDEFLERVYQAKQIVKKQLSLTVESDAVREAMKYPFRAHAIKAIVAVPGHSHSAKLPLLSVLKYFMIYSPSNGVKFSLITPVDLKMKDPKQQKNVIGFNEHEVYTYADAKKKAGNTDLVKDLDYADDSVVDFVIKKHGNIFVSSNFVAGKAGQKKTFLQVVSHQLADQMTNVEQTLDCMCAMVNPYDAKNVCMVTSTKDIAKKGGK